MIQKVALCLALITLLASSASAAVSKKYQEWRNGPAQWIFTKEEQRAWKKVKSDEEASRFIDLFWARRDPTPGTPANEARGEHNGRVKDADQRFSERGKRGAMTDRGRTLIVLGYPTSMGFNAKYATHQGLGADPLTGDGGGRLRGSRDVWMWERDDARKFDLPKVEVVFVEDPGSGKISRDPFRSDFVAAEAAALKSQIVTPNLTEVPAWAPTGGLEPKITVVTVTSVPTQQVPANAPKTEVVAVPPPVIEPDAPMGPRGVSQLTLVREVYEIDSETKTNPFETLQSVEVFKPNEELGWATQVCTGKDEEDPTVRFTLRLTGTAEGEVIDRAAPPDEIIPDRIRALGGCYMLRGSVPLEGMSPGSYELEVAVYDPDTRQDHLVRKAFRIE